MIHAIYIYFIINAFIAGLFHSDLNNWKYTLCWLFFGCLYPLLYIISIIGWIDRKTEIATLFNLYFTNYFKGFNEVQVNRIKEYYEYQVKKNNKYRQWIISQIDKKYNYGIIKIGA